MVEEGPDIVGVEVAGMGGLVEADEADDPADVGRFGVVAVLTAATGLPDAVEELGGLTGGGTHGLKRE